MEIHNAIRQTTNNNTPDETAAELKTKDQLIIKIKEWVKIDNEIRVLQKEHKKRLAD
jgi:predicted XRE-type DNA-binding protein